jgi:formate dehydrogenase iron-sulfur subunit
MRDDSPSLTRRGFLRRGGGAAAGLATVGARTALAVTAGHAAATPDASARLSSLGERAADQFAMLYDSTLCVGCRSCELACNGDNELGRTPEQIFEGRPWQDARALATDVWTYVTFHQEEEDPTTAAFGKVQCMHCIEPACASSCPVSALEKTAAGPVIWHGDLCLGCRYCMMACPFLGALMSGTRNDLLAEAYRRIEQKPRGYIHHVYGEHEAGGTNFLHLAGRPFEDLGYRRNLPMQSYRDYTRPAMATIPYVMSGLGLALGGIAWVAQRKAAVADDSTDPPSRETGERP